MPEYLLEPEAVQLPIQLNNSQYLFYHGSAKCCGNEIPWVGIFQNNHLGGEARSLYRGYRLAMGKSPKKVKPSDRDVILTRSQIGVK